MSASWNTFLLQATLLADKLEQHGFKYVAGEVIVTGVEAKKLLLKAHSWRYAGIDVCKRTDGKFGDFWLMYAADLGFSF